jgi:hypothetical protein
MGNAITTLNCRSATWKVPQSALTILELEFLSLRQSALKGLSHQFESGNKWYGWKEQKQEKSR